MWSMVSVPLYTKLGPATISYILAEVEAICQRVILIDRGRKVLDQPIAEITADGGSLEEVFTRVLTRDDAGSGGEAA